MWVYKAVLMALVIVSVWRLSRYWPLVRAALPVANVFMGLVVALNVWQLGG